MNKYDLYQLMEIDEEIRSEYKRLETHIKIWSEQEIKEFEIWNKGYIKQIKENIKELKKKKKDLLKLRKTLNAKLLSKNIHDYSDDGQSGVKYWVFHKGCTHTDIYQYLELCYGIDIEGYSPNSMYDCTGKRCTSPVDIYEKDKVIVASQHWAYDV